MTVQIIVGDCRSSLADMASESVNCCVTSPPYFGLRDYGHDGQMGLEETPDEFVAGMVGVFREVQRVLRDDGTLWLNIGDSYASQPSWGRGGGSTLEGRKQGLEGGRSTDRTKLPGLKQKDLIGIPWMLAFALRADGWYLRQEIIWHKPNPMPESVTDRCTKAHESLFLLTKSPRYYFDAQAISEPLADANAQRTTDNYNTKDRYGAANGGNSGLDGLAARMRAGDVSTRNKRSVWTVATQPFSGAHFATFPPALIEPCILAGTAPGDTVLDPFGGAGTTGLVADRLQRHATLLELNPEYAALARSRIDTDRGGGLLDAMETAQARSI